MRARRSLLVLLFVVLIPSAKSSAYRAATIAGNVHQGHARHAMPYMQDPVQLRAALTRGDAPKIPISIDGRKTPELIPDAVAYSHFIRAIAPSGSVTDARRRESHFRRAGLSMLDRQALLQALGNVATELERVKQERNANGPSLSTTALQDLKQREDQAVSAAQGRILAGLSPDGVTKLRAHVEGHLKRRIVIYSWAMK